MTSRAGETTPSGTHATNAASDSSESTTGRFYPVGPHTSSRPTMAHQGDAGYDLFASGNHNVRRGEVATIWTGWGVRLRDGEVGLVCPRSGLALNGLTVVNAPGIIDSGYKGEIGVIVTSLAKDIEIIQGMAVAQLVIVRHCDFNNGREREGGFGSSGR